MTKRLEHAFAQASKLPEREQDRLADWLLEELSSEQRWNDALARSQGVLSDLAAEALDEHRKGRTQPLDPDRL